MAGETVPIGSPSSAYNTIFTQATLTATTAGDKIPGMERYTSALFMLSGGTVTGSTPTLDVYIQTLMPDGATWCDILAFTQKTASTFTEKAWFVMGASEVAAITTSTLTQTTAAKIGLGNHIRVNCKLTGTTPSFADVVVYASFYE